MKTFSPPYLLPQPDRIRIVEWFDISRQLKTPLGEALLDWDAASNMRIRVDAVANTSGVLEDCQLGSDARLHLVLSWESSGTGLRSCATAVELEPTELAQDISVNAEIEGQSLSEAVTITVSLILAHPSQRSSRLSPYLSGSILWSTDKRIQLEGMGARFPVESVSFSQSFSWLPDHAAWFLDWDRLDFSRPVFGSMRLYVNSDHSRMKASVSAQDDADKDVRELIRFDVARTMIMTALESDDFVENMLKYPDESVGAAIRRLIRALFASESDTISALNQHRRQFPDRFECELQDRLRLFWKD